MQSTGKYWESPITVLTAWKEKKNCKIFLKVHQIILHDAGTILHLTFGFRTDTSCNFKNQI